MFHTFLVDGSNLSERKDGAEEGKDQSSLREVKEEEGTQYTSWENKRLVGAVLLCEKQRMWVQM